VKLKTLTVLGQLSALAIFAGSCVVAAEAAEKDTASQPTSVFATIGKETVTWQDFSIAFNQAAQKKFYHGNPSDEAVATLQREIAGKLVTDTLVLNEANRRKIKADSAFVNQELGKIESKRAGDAQWEEAKHRVLPILRHQIENESKIKKLTAQIRDVAAPTAAQVRQYYTDHPEKFTAPMEQRVSIILLSVDPSSSNDVWEIGRAHV
jgi:hypothetical protein